MAKWLCSRCGYIYNEDSGEIERGVQPNTPFEKVPDSWVCPRCKAGKSAFKKIS